MKYVAQLKILLNMPNELDDALRWAMWITKKTRQEVIRNAIVLHIKSLENESRAPINQPKKPRGRPKINNTYDPPSLKVCFNIVINHCAFRRSGSPGDSLC